MNNFVLDFFNKASRISQLIDVEKIEKLANELDLLRKRGGRLFLLGVGGSAANCSHAVNDFRKLTNIETYTPIDNVSEITARTNDEGWDTIFSAWLRTSRACEKDAVFILSVGGGDVENNISPNIVEALKEAQKRSMSIYGIIGREEGYTNQVGDVVVVIPYIDKNLLTPFSESFQSLIWHCLVSHPKLKASEAKWESVSQENLSVK